jgi:hypothetical protein
MNACVPPSPVGGLDGGDEVATSNICFLLPSVLMVALLTRKMVAWEGKIHQTSVDGK